MGLAAAIRSLGSIDHYAALWLHVRRETVDVERAVVHLAAMSDMPVDWCRRTIIDAWQAQHRASPHPLPIAAVAHYMVIACALSSCEIDPVLRDRYTGARWWVD